MTDQPELFGGREARDVGMARAAANAGDQFFRDAYSVLPEFKGQEIITEDIKIRMQLRGYPLPDSHQAWGSWTKEARRDGKIIPVKGPDGKYKLRQCRKRESHARDSKVYRVK
jgi:hypothetical protein